MARVIKNPIKGYKVFELNTRDQLKCRKTIFGSKKTALKHHVLTGDPKLCSHGYHFCRKLKDCFAYYTFNSKTHVICEVRAHKKVDHQQSSVYHKSCTTDLEIVRILTLDEVNKIIAKELGVSPTDEMQGCKNVRLHSELTWNGTRNIRKYFFKDSNWNRVPIVVPKRLQLVTNLGKVLSVTTLEKWTNLEPNKSYSYTDLDKSKRVSVKYLSVL